MPYHNILRRLLFGLLLSVTCVQALGVLYPIYWNPDTTCAAFNSSINLVTAYPETSFYIVINPDDGPGDDRSAPRAGFQAYAVDTYSAYISHARSQNFTFIALNAGGAADAAYFPLADMINTYESSYASFKTSQLMNTDSTPPSKQAVTLFETPSTGSYLSVLTELADLGVAAVYMTNATEYGVRGVPPPFAALLPEIKDLQTSSSSTASQPSGSSTSTASTSSGSSTGSSPASTATASQPSGSDSGKSRSPVAAIVGGVLGGLVLILGLLLVSFCLRRQNTRLKSQPTSKPILSPFGTDIESTRTGFTSGTVAMSPVGTRMSAKAQRTVASGTTTPSVGYNSPATPSAGFHSPPPSFGLASPTASVRPASPTIQSASNRPAGSRGWESPQEWESYRASGPPPSYYTSGAS
ncbi:hypothetical protein B0H16DRAFT_1788304 [Mycena metata]|uniref:Uncharacterized protein n=1 Tax=Mycena metata TaxID=1033252 RepID=A0AAD7MM20_9AGAR|nr:hypothetical protein B0H16DRAFT_1788304 [Mycena metata]